MAHKITVITPTYNRADKLPALYESLKAQTLKKDAEGNSVFEWFIVDDGSSDNTSEVVAEWFSESVVDIRYEHKENGGKHTALNLAISECRSDLVIIVDSDDTLAADAVESILATHEKYKDDEALCGYSFLRGFPDGKVNGAEFPTDEWRASYITARVNSDDMQADKAEVFRTKVLKQFPFPEMKGERFIGEDVVWMRMSRKYLMIHVNKVIYIGDYLEDGLTKNRRKHNIDNPKGCVLRAMEFMKPDVNTKARLKASVQYIVYGRFAGLDLMKLVKKSRFRVWALMGLVPGEILYKKWSAMYGVKVDEAYLKKAERMAAEKAEKENSHE